MNAEPVEDDTAAHDAAQIHAEECFDDCGTCHRCGEPQEEGPYGGFGRCGDCFGGTDSDPYVNTELLARWHR